MGRTVNHPVCSHCGYDVRGLPTQTCPECGREYDLNGRPVQSFASRVLHEAVVAACVVLGFFISLIQVRISPWLGMVEFHENYRLRDESELLCVAALLGVFYAPLTVFVSKRARVWVLIPPTLMILNAFAFLVHGSHYIISSTTLSMLVATLPFLPMAVSSPVRTAAAVSGVFVAWPAIISARMVVGSCVRLQMNMNWSPWPDPRKGQLYDQYPLTNTEAIWVGLGLGAATLPIVLLWVWVFRHQLRRAKAATIRGCRVVSRRIRHVIVG